MQSSLVCQVYKAGAAEKKALEQFCLNWSGDFWAFDEVELSLKIPGTLLLYASVGGIWQGVLLARDLGSTAELYYIYVSSEARGQGIGLRLMGTFEAFLLQNCQTEEVFLEVRPSNLEAIRLYEKCAFSQAGRRKKYYSNGDDALIYTRLISRP